MEATGVAEAYAAAIRAGDLAGLREMRHRDYVARWPQSGELVRGRDHAGEIERGDPGGTLRVDTVRRIAGRDELWTVEAVATDPDGARWWWVTILELKGGLVLAATDYFCEPFAAPAWRAAHVQRFDGTLPPALLAPATELSATAARRLGEGYGAAVKARDFATLGTLRDRSWICEWPQSGERLPDHAADMAVHMAYPGYPDVKVARLATSSEGWELTPMLIPIRVHGAGPMALIEGVNDYPTGERWFVIELLDVGGDRIRRETAYFGRPFEAPAWRSALVEAYDPLAAS